MEDRNGKDAGSEANPPADNALGCGPSDECVWSFADVYRNYRLLVLTTALRTLGDPMAAEDVAQDVFIKVLRGSHASHFERLGPKYFQKVTENACRTWITRRRPEDSVAPVVIDERAGGTPRPDLRVIRAEEREILARVLEGLPVECRKVTELFLAGYTTLEIGETLEKSEKAVEKQKTRMYRYMEAYGEGLRVRWDGVSPNEGGGGGRLMGYHGRSRWFCASQSTKLRGKSWGEGNFPDSLL